PGQEHPPEQGDGGFDLARMHAPPGPAANHADRHPGLKLPSRLLPEVDATGAGHGVEPVDDEEVVAHDPEPVGGQPAEGGALAAALGPADGPGSAGDHRGSGVEALPAEPAA